MIIGLAVTESILAPIALLPWRFGGDGWVGGRTLHLGHAVQFLAALARLYIKGTERRQFGVDRTSITEKRC